MKNQCLEKRKKHIRACSLLPPNTLLQYLLEWVSQILRKLSDVLFQHTWRSFLRTAQKASKITYTFASRTTRLSFESHTESTNSAVMDSVNPDKGVIIGILISFTVAMFSDSLDKFILILQ